MRFFYNIYGIDLLSLFLLFLSSLLNLTFFTRIFSFLIFLIAILRMFSKNIYKRQNENLIFITFLNKILKRFKVQIPTNLPPVTFNSLIYSFKVINAKFNEFVNFKITKCPSCGQKLRLPRRKGKIIVTCKRCSNKFDLKT